MTGLRLAAAAAYALAGAFAGAAPLIWVEPDLVKVAPDAAPAPSNYVWDGERVSLKAARGEWESFQIIVRDDVARQVAFEVYDLESPRGEIPGRNVKLFRELFLNVEWPSAEAATGFIVGEAGPQADPLVPVVGHMDVAAAENSPVWVDVYVPPGTYAGKYIGNIRVKWSGGEKVLPLELTVWDFELPKFGSYALLADVDAEDVYRLYDDARDDAARLHLVEKYLTMLTDHRVVPANAADFYPPESQKQDGGSAWDWRKADAKLGYYYDVLKVPWLAAPRAVDVAAVYEHYREKGWLYRTYYPAAETGGRRGAAADTPVLYEGPLYSAPGDGAPAYGGLWATSLEEGAAYPGRLAALRGDAFEVGFDAGGLADLVDRPATDYRVAAWACRRFGGDFLMLGGVSYFPRGPEAALAGDPRNEFGNGGRALIYPGGAAGVDGPLASIRLKLAREAAEDYLYLSLLAEGGMASYADELAAAVVPVLERCRRLAPAALNDAREAAALALVKGAWGQKIAENVVAGVAVDDEGEPVAGAVIHAGPTAAVTDGEGRYELHYVPRGRPLTAEAPGYEKAGSSGAGGRGDFFMRRLIRRYLLNGPDAPERFEAGGFKDAAAVGGRGRRGGAAVVAALKPGREGRLEMRPALTDWRTFGGLAMDLYNGGAAGVTTRVQCRDGAGGYYEEAFLLAPGEWRGARVDLAAAAERYRLEVRGAGANFSFKASPPLSLSVVEEVAITFEGPAGGEVRLGRVWLEAVAKP